MVARSPALRRRRLAATIGVAWLLAVLILPALHLGHHDHAHEHRADGTIVTVTVTVTNDDHAHGPGAAPHRHDDLADEFSEEDAADHGAPPQREPDRPAVSAPHLDHAAAGAAHLGLAVLEPPPPTGPARATAAPLRPLPPPPIDPDDVLRARPRARAPPR